MHTYCLERSLADPAWIYGPLRLARYIAAGRRVLASPAAQRIRGKLKKGRTLTDTMQQTPLHRVPADTCVAMTAERLQSFGKP
jgi:hypothetical protein